MLRRVAAFCRPQPVLLLVSFPRSRSPVVGVLGLCWMWRDVPFARQRHPVVGVLGLCWLSPPPRVLRSVSKVFLVEITGVSKGISLERVKVFLWRIPG